MPRLIPLVNPATLPICYLWASVTLLGRLVSAMWAGEQACTIIRRETTECCLQLLRLSFEADPAQFPNKFDCFAGCFLLRSVIREPVFQLTSLHTNLLRPSFCDIVF
jgi:hypothetical protein